MIGHRALEDPRNALVGEFVRLVSELRPSYFVFENVKGLTVGSHRSFLDELIEAFRGSGYRVRLPWQVLDAAHFGVPQHRERLVLLGARNNLQLPSYPAPLCSAGEIEDPQLPQGPSCLDALADLPDADRFPELLSSDEVRTQCWGRPSIYAAAMRCQSSESWFQAIPANGIAVYSRQACEPITRLFRGEGSKPPEKVRLSRYRVSTNCLRMVSAIPSGLALTPRAGHSQAPDPFTMHRHVV